MQTQALSTTDSQSAIVPMDVSAAALQSALAGDLGLMGPSDRLKFYGALCKFTGLNPLAKPFDWLTLNGKLVLYANKGCAEQLRKIHHVSVDIIERKVEFGVLIVRVKATSEDGRHDESLAAVPFNDRLPPEAIANAMMKAETKAKRRVTFSICGLSMLLDREADLEETVRADVVTEAETAQDRVAKLNRALTAGQKGKAIDATVAETAVAIETTPAEPLPAGPTNPPAEHTAPELQRTETQAPTSTPPPSAAVATLSEEEVRNLEIVLAEKPELQNAALGYMVVKGGLEKGKDIAFLQRNWFLRIMDKPHAFWRNVELFKARLAANAELSESRADNPKR